MDIGERFIEAALENRDADAAALVEMWPIELWYSLPPYQLGTLLERLSPEAHRLSPTVSLLSRALTPDDTTFRMPRRRGPLPANHHRRASIFEAARRRVAGDPVGAYELLAGLRENIAGASRSGVGPTDPALAFVLMQTAESALLAGRLREALSLFEELAAAPRSAGMEFFARRAHLRGALIHHLYGSTCAARSHLQQAQGVPRTASWVEKRLDGDQRLVEALIATEDSDEAFSELLDLTYSDLGELWPFAVIALHAWGSVTGRRDAARSRMEAMANAGFGRDGTGLIGSVLPLMLALDSVLNGDLPRARAEIHDVHEDHWIATVVRALIDIGSAAPGRARDSLGAAADATTGLVKADRQRHQVTALAHYLSGDTGSASATIALLPVSARRCSPYEISVLDTLAPGVLGVVADLVPELLPEGYPFDRAGVLEKPSLTRPELEVLTRLARGMKRPDIARELFRSINTVKTHQRSLYRKLGASSAAEAVALATESGYLWHPPQAAPVTP
ncbi:helix-turn-helix transcriptional regulator [Microbacterium azadirachtae]|uniref:helix-turn-helix transcriptional regulator n=1 Tax=Microbacterium azadirachtae TaxID=582680 RepID=UPI000891F7CA|nr:helix-turn-helix transcriptional regulator [Microbacterium azadirachtae]SDL57713.1 regulatory protein, luxR family [Microbacterium azadirachtae]SEF86557.1 regulatory protein, luxR family [Microbacterium azadirachtae]SEF88430.1 regulatory protein, luxR family [Microbacterium azadirachtae]